MKYLVSEVNRYIRREKFGQVGIFPLRVIVRDIKTEGPKPERWTWLQNSYIDEAHSSHYKYHFFEAKKIKSHPISIVLNSFSKN